MKRLFDIIFSFLGILFLSPILVVISIVIKLHDRGPVFFKAPRVGLYGKMFKMIKFRSMVVNAEKIGASSTTSTDPRITPIGKFIRKYKMDEIPQLFNVLKGEMSFVGPRPEVKYFTDMYTDEEKAILTVKPGITDWASICNSNEEKILEGSEDPDKAYMEQIRPEKIRFQLKYVREKSFFTDLKIILLTLLAIFKK